jgi:hypothetical protein
MNVGLASKYLTTLVQAITVKVGTIIPSLGFAPRSATINWDDVNHTSAYASFPIANRMPYEEGHTSLDDNSWLELERQ